ncbi:ATP-binding protein [Streptomyces sp. NPDC053431]|uniref:ATP-binding protein n=1 Tax=Streptomyces sp. NPDC053431 TaxID=3365703 RepID=UPI0037D86E12
MFTASFAAPFPAQPPRSTPLTDPSASPALPRPREERRALCVMRATVEAVPLLRRFVRETARRWIGDGADEALGVIATELVANAVRHSGSPDVAVLLTATGGTLSLQVQDSGTWRNRRTRRPGDDAACCGRGLRLVRAYALDCAIVRTARGTRVAVTLPADATPDQNPAGRP